MKKFIIAILGFCLVSFTGFAQVKIQGTLVDPLAGGTKVQVYGKNNSATDLTNVLFGNINIAFSILDQGVLNPTEAQITKASLIPSLDLLPAPGNNPQIVGGRAYYSYLMNNLPNIATTSTWPAGSNNNPIAEFTFPVNTYFTSLRLDDLSPNGGPNGQMFWYVQVNGAGDITDYANMFFGGALTPPTNNGQASPSFVPLQPFGVLPVKFLGFKVIKKNNDAILNWQIENENDLTDRYEVERSLNGVDFQNVNTITPKNNGLSGNSYDLTDFNLTALRSAGIFYYRIKQYDKDGHYIYSETRSVRFTSKGIVMGIYPNPLRDLANLSIDLEQDANATITINDASGKQVQYMQTILFKGPNIKKINMGAFTAGSYLLKLQTATEIKTMSIVKTN
ncbi:MAG: T9SS type A sorting domain-containing protein [Ferruginibacter sp.]